MIKTYSLHQIQKQKIVYWIKSYKTLRSYVHYFGHILKPIKMGKNTGSRYYIKEENLKKFVEMFEQNKLIN